MSTADNTRDLSIIIPAMNEESTIESVLREVEQLRPKEIITVVNGSSDGTARIARDRGHVVFEFPDPLGHDVTRSVGASISTGSILLFVDSDIVIPFQELEPFVNAAEFGYEVVLNDIDPFARLYPWDPVSVLKKWLNVCLGRADLETASLTAVPHALSRSVFQHIDPADLSVPPKAYAKLLLAGARVTLANQVNVVTTNKVRKQHGIDGSTNLMLELIIGDHAEALAWIQDRLGPHGQFQAFERDDEILRERLDETGAGVEAPVTEADAEKERPEQSPSFQFPPSPEDSPACEQGIGTGPSTGPGTGPHTGPGTAPGTGPGT